MVIRDENGCINGSSQGTKADLTGTTNGTAWQDGNMQKNVTYFVAAIVSGAVLLILADNRRKENQEGITKQKEKRKGR
ncbi:MAG: hypothetical protein ACLTAF_02590 [Blautia coccoides]